MGTEGTLNLHGRGEEFRLFFSIIIYHFSPMSGARSCDIRSSVMSIFSTKRQIDKEK